MASNFTCQQTCNTPCLTCLSNPSSCTACLTGYYLNQVNQCIPNPNCTGPCQICPFAYVLSNSVCIPCQNGNCARCLVDNTNICTSCFDGLYLTLNGTCQTCPPGCATCSNQYNCLTCSSNYTAIAQPVSTVIQCVAC